jgi:arylsulfatase A-like enzyme
MNNSVLTRLLVLLVVYIAGICGSDRSLAAQRPNIVYIMADELGYFEPGFMGGRTIRTPNLDRMAAEGMFFKNMFAGSSVCAPTRCCLLTGKHGGHTSVRANGGGTPLRADEETIASLLKRQGYATGGFGKWGCGGRGSTGVPEKHGFDIFLGYYDQVHAHTYYPPYLVRNSEEVPLAGNNGGGAGQTYSQYVIHKAALDFIREHHRKPFFAYLPYTPPHGTFSIPDDDPAWASYQDKPWPIEARRYAAMVTMLDGQVGEVLTLLHELGIEDNTLVMFSGDNGGADYFTSPEHPRGFHSANKHSDAGLEYRGNKGTLYEGGVRVPFVARWPGKIASGGTSEMLAYFPDILPTVTELAAAETPADVDGISLVPTLLGQIAAGRPQAEHEYLYWEINGWIAVRKQQWRAVKPPKSQSWELYDLSADPGETVNLAAAQPKILAELTALAAAAHEAVREGSFADTQRHERDRRSKYGKHDDPSYEATPSGVRKKNDPSSPRKAKS